MLNANNFSCIPANNLCNSYQAVSNDDLKSSISEHDANLKLTSLIDHMIALLCRICLLPKKVLIFFSALPEWKLQ